MAERAQTGILSKFLERNALISAGTARRIYGIDRKLELDRKEEKEILRFALAGYLNDYDPAVQTIGKILGSITWRTLFHIFPGGTLVEKGLQYVDRVNSDVSSYLKESATELARQTGRRDIISHAQALGIVYFQDLPPGA